MTLVVEMTSGNMGVGLAVVCKQFGNPFVAVMSEGNSLERRKILKALGADILLTKQIDGINGMVTRKDIEYVAVEPENAAILKTGIVKSSRHIIQGTGYSIVPLHWDKDLADDIITISDKEAREMTMKLSQEHGLFVGYSAGANIAASVKFLQANPEIKNIVTILCDLGYKYSDL